MNATSIQRGGGTLHERFQMVPGRILNPGVGIGTVTDVLGQTGVTVLVLPPGSIGSVDVSGGAPATRETDVLDPGNLVPGPDAVVLTGGSAFGLRTADGVMDALAQAGRGFAVGTDIRVPIVVAAGIFDLTRGPAAIPSRDDGFSAAQEALEGGRGREGLAGAGTGATVGKMRGIATALAGGQAFVTLTAPEGIFIGVGVVVNAVGTIYDEQGAVLAGPRDASAEPVDAAGSPAAGSATTIGVVVTNVGLTKAELKRVARMAQDGLARCIDPVHTAWDGDTIFAVSHGDRTADVSQVGAWAAHAITFAVRRAVRLGLEQATQG